MKPLKVGDKVYVKKVLNEPNVPAKITKICDGPRSYDLELGNKKKIERNRRHIFGPINDKKNNVCYERDDDIPNKITNDKDVVIHSNIPDDSENISDDNNINAGDDTNIVTKSGRIVKTPKYLFDYER